MNAVLGDKGVDYFFGGTLASFTDFPTRNFTTFLARVLIASPVAGWRPARSFRSTRTNRPRPGIANTPDFSERSAISERTKASCFETPSFFAVSKTEGNGVVIFA